MRAGEPTAGRAEQGRRVLVEYLEALERFDLDAALACFAEDVEYSHAPFRHLPGTGRRVARGRAALRELFEARGPLPIGHVVDTAAAAGDRCLVAGFVVRDGVDEASFVSDFELSAEGLIRSYVGYSTAPPARLRTPGPDGRRLP